MSEDINVNWDSSKDNVNDTDGIFKSLLKGLAGKLGEPQGEGA